MKDYEYWTRQIASAKQEHKNWIKQCRDIGKLYTNSKIRMNILFSNTQLLKAALLNNDPKPEITRRFYNALESDKHLSDLYSDVSRVAAAAVEYYFTKNDAFGRFKKGVENELLYGREVLWVEYVPTIVQIPVRQSLMGRIGNALGIAPAPMQEKVADREIKITALKPAEYLQSYAENPDAVWWRGRRHLCDRSELQRRFGYDAADNELSFVEDGQEDKETARRCGEVWEIWDKQDKKRIFVLLGAKSHEVLEEKPDPYGLSDFWPCWVHSFLTDEETTLPVPEYTIYQEMANEINQLADKNHVLRQKIKYVQICSNKNQELVEQIQGASDGDVIGAGAYNADIGALTTAIDVSAARQVITDNETSIANLKNQIWELTGMADLMRGAADPRETATAQKIKGFYGGLRFRDRQLAVQDGVRTIFRIVAELICEHWDWDTLAQISSLDLMSNDEKVRAEKIAAAGVQLPPAAQKKMYQPTSDEVLGVLRNDRMRNFIIDIESTATEFDNREAQAAEIQKLTDVYITAVKTGQELASPEFLDGFSALVKMNLVPIKVSHAISNQLTDSLAVMANKMRDAQGKAPEPTAEDKKLQAEMVMQDKKLAQERELAVQKMQLESAYKTRELDIREREAATKEYEIQQEAAANAVRVVDGLAPDTNLG